MRVAVVVPALDEAGNIGSVVEETLDQPVEWVFVVDNGSSDGTGAAAGAAGATVLVEPRRGYGFACAAGSAAALAAGADVIVYLDGDGSSPPSEIPRLLAPIEDGGALVLGSRTLGVTEDDAMGPHQRLGNRFAAMVTRRLYGVDVTDLGPFRAIRADVFERLAMTEMTFGWPTEMTVKSVRLGVPVNEVPVSWKARRSGSSKVSGTVRGSLLAGYHILSVTLRHWRR